MAISLPAVRWDDNPKRLQVWRTSVDTEYLVVNHDAQRQEIEHIREIMPHIGVAVLA